MNKQQLETKQQQVLKKLLESKVKIVRHDQEHLKITNNNLQFFLNINNSFTTNTNISYQ